MTFQSCVYSWKEQVVSVKARAKLGNFSCKISNFTRVSLYNKFPPHFSHLMQKISHKGIFSSMTQLLAKTSIQPVKPTRICVHLTQFSHGERNQLCHFNNI